MLPCNNSPQSKKLAKRSGRKPAAGPYQGEKGRDYTKFTSRIQLDPLNRSINRK